MRIDEDENWKGSVLLRILRVARVNDCGNRERTVFTLHLYTFRLPRSRHWPTRRDERRKTRHTIYLFSNCNDSVQTFLVLIMFTPNFHYTFKNFPKFTFSKLIVNLIIYILSYFYLHKKLYNNSDHHRKMMVIIDRNNNRTLSLRIEFYDCSMTYQIVIPPLSGYYTFLWHGLLLYFLLL